MKWSRQTKWITYIDNRTTAFITKETHHDHYEWWIEENWFFPTKRTKVLAFGKSVTLRDSKKEVTKFIKTHT